MGVLEWRLTLKFLHSVAQSQLMLGSSSTTEYWNLRVSLHNLSFSSHNCYIWRVQFRCHIAKLSNIDLPYGYIPPNGRILKQHWHNLKITLQSAKLSSPSNPLLNEPNCLWQCNECNGTIWYNLGLTWHVTVMGTWSKQKVTLKPHPFRPEYDTVYEICNNIPYDYYFHQFVLNYIRHCIISHIATWTQTR